MTLAHDKGRDGLGTARGHDRPALRLAVVGHTNTGKTSLLRTLTRDPDFGDVDDSPGTTRHVQGARLHADDGHSVELFDTPGLEDSMALLDYLEQQLLRGDRLDGPDQIQRFLDSPGSRDRFEQEARVLRTLLRCDAGIYVVDARDPVLAKHRDELSLLARCGHPLVPVLNFTHDPRQRGDQWREALRRLGLHVIVEFDTVAPPLDGEDELYDKLALLLDGHAPLLRALRDSVNRQRVQRRHDSGHLIADMVIDVAAWRLSALPEEAAVQAALTRLREGVRQREQRCVQAMLRRFNFDALSFAAHDLPLEDGRWAMDLFQPEALREMGIHVTKGLAAGAMAGATLDAFTAGISLGTGTVLGAVAGGLWQGADKWGRRLFGRLRGHQELTVDDAILRLLIVRQQALLAALERRGHAARTPISLPEDGAYAVSDGQGSDYRKSALPDAIELARAHPEWSSMDDRHEADARRDQAVRALATLLVR